MKIKLLNICGVLFLVLLFAALAVMAYEPWLPTVNEMRNVKIGLSSKKIIEYCGMPQSIELMDGYEEWNYRYHSYNKIKWMTININSNDSLVTRFLSY
jgi:hypothetical protein